MAYRCVNCNKGVMYGHNVSHAKNRTRKVFKPNLQVATVSVDGRSRRVRLCTKCLRMSKSLKQVKSVSVVASVDQNSTPVTA